MSNKYKIRNQHGLNYLTCTICGWVDLFTRAEYRDIVLGSWRYCSQHKGLQDKKRPESRREWLLYLFGFFAKKYKRAMRENFLWIMQLVCIIAMFACHAGKQDVIKEKIRCDDCNNYRSYIKNNWKIDSVGLFFFAASPDCEEFIHGKTGVSYTMIVGRNCLIGSQTDAIKRLFGAPTEEYQNRFDYYMTAQCQGKARGDSPNIPGCIRLQVYFDENHKVVGVGGMTRE